MWALWVLGGLVLWAVVAVAVGVVIGRGVRLADERQAAGAVLPGAARSVAARSVATRARRRAVPLPPVGVALAAVAVVLEASGYVLRLRHATGPVMRVLSMDAPLSLPRLYVAGLFSAAAAAALIGAGNLPGRRAWWTAVGVIGGSIAAVKAGGTLHAATLHALSGAVGSAVAQGISVLLALAVLGLLWWLSRFERRDRRRVLGTLGLYAVAAVGLSAVSGLVAAHAGSWGLTAAATFVEEAGEALSGVAFLVAVLVGVAPRLVLPAEWRLRREADAHTLEVGPSLPGVVSGPWTPRR
jgi:hypothetical protein